MIAIDPGATGAIVYDCVERGVVAVKMPGTYPDIYEALKVAREAHPSNDVCFMEKVGDYMPGNSGPAAATFARHCGHLDMAVYALQLRLESVRPQKWQASLGLSEQPKKKGLDSKVIAKLKQERKNEIKEKMQAKFPKLKVTLAVSDALGIFCWGKEQVR